MDDPEHSSPWLKAETWREYYIYVTRGERGWLVGLQPVSSDILGGIIEPEKDRLKGEYDTWEKAVEGARAEIERRGQERK